MHLTVYSDTLYAAAGNWGVAPFARGAQIWRTTDGLSWTNVVTQGFGNANTAAIISLQELDGYLYAGTWSDAIVGQLWRSPSGNAGYVDGGEHQRVGERGHARDSVPGGVQRQLLRRDAQLDDRVGGVPVAGCGDLDADHQQRLRRGRGRRLGGQPDGVRRQAVRGGAQLQQGGAGLRHDGRGDLAAEQRQWLGQPGEPALGRRRQRGGGVQRGADHRLVQPGGRRRRSGSSTRRRWPACR